MTQHDGGKGDKQITPTDKEQFDKNWDMVFGKNKPLKYFVEEAMKEEYAKHTEELIKNGTL